MLIKAESENRKLNMNIPFDGTDSPVGAENTEQGENENPAARPGCSGKGIFTRALDGLFRFAVKPYSLPIFVLITFGCLLLSAAAGGYEPLKFDETVGFTFYQFFLSDFSAGFCSRVIVGAIVTFFTDSVSIELITAIANTAVVVSYVIMAVIAGICLRRGFVEKSFPCILLTLLFVLDPLISQVNYVFLGTLDVYSLIIFFVTVSLFGTNIFYFAAPVLSFLGMTVHYHYMLTFFPAVVALYVYDIFVYREKHGKIISVLSFATTSVTGAASFIYFVFLAKNYLKTTADEYYNAMVSRFSISQWEGSVLKNLMDGNVLFRDYYDYYIFGWHGGEYYYDSGSDFIGLLKNDRLSRTPDVWYVKYLALAIPLFIVFIAIWLICAKKQKGSKRLPFVAFALIPIMLLPELYISTDVMRWISMSLTCQFVLFFVLYLKKDSTLTGIVNCNNFRHRTLIISLSVCGAVLYTVLALCFGSTTASF